MDSEYVSETLDAFQGFTSVYQKHKASNQLVVIGDTSSMGVCSVCKVRSVIVESVQTRAADEEASEQIRCLFCTTIFSSVSDNTK